MKSAVIFTYIADARRAVKKACELGYDAYLCGKEVRYEADEDLGDALVCWGLDREYTFPASGGRQDLIDRLNALKIAFKHQTSVVNSLAADSPDFAVQDALLYGLLQRAFEVSRALRRLPL